MFLINEVPHVINIHGQELIHDRDPESEHTLNPKTCRGTSLIRNRDPVGPYSRTMPTLLWWRYGGRRFLISKVTLYTRHPCTPAPESSTPKQRRGPIMKRELTQNFLSMKFTTQHSIFFTRHSERFVCQNVIARFF